MSGKVTLSDLLSLLDPSARLFVVHHLGANISEAVAGGTGEELRATRCAEVGGDNIVERIAVDVDDWPDTPAPVLLVTIGGKELRKMMDCAKCEHPQHEQYKGYLGHWYCFHRETCGKKICDTPVEEWGDFPTNNRRLAEAKTPKWCPLNQEI